MGHKNDRIGELNSFWLYDHYFCDWNAVIEMLYLVIETFYEKKNRHSSTTVTLFMTWPGRNKNMLVSLVMLLAWFLWRQRRISDVRVTLTK